MNYKEFFKITDKLDRNKFHTCCEIVDTNICNWVIFRKDMPYEEYWSANNRPVLNSKVNTKQDLIDFVSINLEQ